MSYLQLIGTVTGGIIGFFFGSVNSPSFYSFGEVLRPLQAWPETLTGALIGFSAVFFVFSVVFAISKKSRVLFTGLIASIVLSILAVGVQSLGFHGGVPRGQIFPFALITFCFFAVPLFTSWYILKKKNGLV